MVLNCLENVGLKVKNRLKISFDNIFQLFAFENKISRLWKCLKICRILSGFPWKASRSQKSKLLKNLLKMLITVIYL